MKPAPSIAATGPVTPSLGAARAPSQNSTSRVLGLANGATPPSKVSFPPVTRPVKTLPLAVTFRSVLWYRCQTWSTNGSKNVGENRPASIP